MNDIPMKKCPYCAENIRAEAVKCRYCGSPLGPQPQLGAQPRPSEWYRDKLNNKFAGVCAGLSFHLGVPVSLLRIAFVIATIFGGWGLLIYIILWIVMPVGPPQYFGATAWPDGRAEPASNCPASGPARPPADPPALEKE